jgi:hypothetical protein
MGFFSDLFNRGNHRVETLLNPLLGMKLQQFVIADDDPVYMKHYFQFKNKEGKNEEFVVILRRFDPELLYVHTHHRRAGESFFITLSERVWSISISHLIELGKSLSATTHPTTGHFVSNVSAGVLVRPDWVPPPTANPSAKPEEPPAPVHNEQKSKLPNGMIKLKALPIGEDGAAIWTDEIQSATQAHGPEFLAAFMFETSPGMCIGGFVAKAILKTPVRTYEARATLIERKNDEFRTTVVVTAPGVSQEQAGDYPWLPYRFQYNTSIPKECVRDFVNTIRQACEKSHGEELQARERTKDEIPRDSLGSSDDEEQDNSIVKDAFETEPDEGNLRISVDFTPWEMLSGHRYNEMGRSYEFNGLAGPGSHTRFEIVCRLRRAKDSRHEVAPFIYFVVEPYILEQAGFLAAQFAPSDEPIEYSFITVRVEPIATGANFILLTDEANTDQCLSVLMLGRQITMRLISKEGQLAHFLLENDAGFARRFSELKLRVLSQGS